MRRCNTRCKRHRVPQFAAPPVTAILPFSRSRGVQGFLHRLRRALDDEQIGARRPFRLTVALLPMTQRIDAEAESAGELFLSHAKFRADRPHVDQRRHMDPVIAFLCLTARIGDGLLQTATDAIGCLAHFFVLPQLPANSLVSRRKSSRSKSAARCSPLD